MADTDVLVLNNGILGYQKHVEEVRFGEHTIAVNFAAVAPAMRAALATNAPVLLDIVTDPDAKPPISAFAGHYPEPF